MKYVALVSITIATLVLAYGYALAESWILAGATVGLGLLWSVTLWRGWKQAIPAGLITFVSLAALGVRLEINTIWMLLGTVATLVAWDWANFSQRVTQTEPMDTEPALQEAHYRRLMIVGGLGLVLGGAALGLQFNLTFGRAVLLGLLIAISLSGVVGFIRRASDTFR